MKKNYPFILFLTILFILLLYPPLSSGGELEKGIQIYKDYCSVCHGEEGKGDGINARSGMDPLPRDFTDGKEKYMVKRTKEELFDAVTKGGREIEKSALMPPFGNTLSEQEIWSVVAYIRNFSPIGGEGIDFSKMKTERAKISISAVSIAEGEAGDIKAGKKAYQKYGCSGCHKIDGKLGVSGPDLTSVGLKLKGEEIYKIIKNSRSVKTDSKMPVYGLDDEITIGITQYLLSLK